MNERKAIEEGLNDLDWESYEQEKQYLLVREVAEVRMTIDMLLKGEWAEHEADLIDQLAEVTEQTPIKTIIALAYQVNRAAKDNFYTEGKYYDIKDALINIALIKAEEGELEEDHWGYKYDENGDLVFYFDVIGIGQISFHRPDYVRWQLPFDVPEYPHAWVGPRESEPEESDIHPLDVVISARERDKGRRVPIDRNTMLKVAAHPDLGRLKQGYIAKLHKLREDIPPEMSDMFPWA